MDKLLPCPFCGGEAALREWDGFGQYVRCTRCRACGPIKPKPLLTEAIAAWNRRAQPANEPLTLEELRQMDGEPVFAVDGEGHSAWVVVNAKDECCADNEFGSWAFSYYEMMMPKVLTESENELHPMGWLAYRSKPKEDV